MFEQLQYQNKSTSDMTMMGRTGQGQMIKLNSDIHIFEKLAIKMHYYIKKLLIVK